MPTQYEVVTQTTGQIVKRTDEDGAIWWIPMTEENSDYQAYLRWLENPDAEEGGTL